MCDDPKSAPGKFPRALKLVTNAGADVAFLKPGAANPDPSQASSGQTARFFRQHRAWLLARLHRLYGAQHADDLLQETFLAIARYEARAKPVEHPRALLARIAHHAFIDGRRRAAARISGAAVDLELVASEPCLAMAPEQVENLLLKQIILAMPAMLRDVFVLHRFAGLTYGEIALQLGISAKTVEWRMSKALAYCAREVHQDPPAWGRIIPLIGAVRSRG